MEGCIHSRNNVLYGACWVINILEQKEGIRWSSTKAIINTLQTKSNRLNGHRLQQLEDESTINWERFLRQWVTWAPKNWKRTWDPAEGSIGERKLFAIPPDSFEHFLDFMLFHTLSHQRFRYVVSVGSLTLVSWGYSCAWWCWTDGDIFAIDEVQKHA